MQAILSPNFCCYALPICEGVQVGKDCVLQIDGPPAFLDPEATRQGKICAAHVLQQSSVNESRNAAAAETKANFDISKLAPRLKGQPDTQAVLSAPAKRGREASETPQAPAFSNVALVCPFVSPFLGILQS